MPDRRFPGRAQACDAAEDIPTNDSDETTLGDLIAARYNRRTILKGALGATAMGALAASPLALLAGRNEPGPAASPFGFTEIAHGVDETHQVAPGYRADILIRWGDPVLPDAPAFDPHGQSAAAQRRQFGYNNDFIGYIPLPLGSDNSDHGLLCINHEYTSEEVMFPGAGKNITSTRAPRTSSTATDAWCSTPGTTKPSSTSTSSSPPTGSIPTTAPPTGTCWTGEPCSSPDSTPTEPSPGYP